MASALIVGFATSASAEVRLRAAGSSPTVEITATERGPWSARGPIDGLVLNPSGDLVGDGFPTWALSGRRVLISWARPYGHLVTAMGDVKWTVPATMSVTGLVGSPVTVAIADSWAIAWQVAAPEPSVGIVGIDSSDRRSETHTLADQSLVGLRPIGSSLVVVTVTVVGDLSVTPVLMSTTPELDPILIPATRSPIQVESLDFAPTATTLVVPDGYGQHAKGARAATAPDIRVHSGSRHGTPYALVTWWVSTTELHWIELTEDGPAFPVEVLHAPGNAAYSQSLVQQAVNEVRAR